MVKNVFTSVPTVSDKIFRKLNYTGPTTSKFPTLSNDITFMQACITKIT